jgi:uracil-DNA glycosylase
MHAAQERRGRRTGIVHEPTGIDVVATYHPSAVLRVPDAPAREALRGQRLEDLGRARRLASAKRGRQE